MKVVFTKDNFHSFIFLFLFEKHVKVDFCKNDFRLKFLLKFVFFKDDFQSA